MEIVFIPNCKLTNGNRTENKIFIHLETAPEKIGKLKKYIKQYTNKLTIIDILVLSKKLWKKYIKPYIANPNKKKNMKIYILSK